MKRTVVKVVDLQDRKIDYMRISITDRCNLRCKYCMPDDIETIPMAEILTFEEIVECVKVAAKLGIKYIKVTGGEPLVRKGCSDLIAMIKSVDGIEKVTLTTNGVLLEENIESLVSAGIDGINISLDTLDRDRYKMITGFDELPKVLRGIETAYKSGVRTKINVVALGSSFANELSEEYKLLVEKTLRYDLDVRFIEMMPIGLGKLYPAASTEKILKQIVELYPETVRDYSRHGYGPAVYYKLPGAMGSIGFISAIHGKFCSECNRIRLSSTGFMKSCLCFNQGADLREILRDENDDFTKEKKLVEVVKQVILNKPKEHCFEDKTAITEEKYMASIGG